MDVLKRYEIIKEFCTNTVRLRLLSNGIIHYSFLPNSIVCEVEHQINHDAIVNFTQNIKHFFLVDSGEFVDLTPEARTLVRELEEIAPIAARAVVVQTLAERILMNFYITFHKPIVSTKVFSNHETALEWIENKKALTISN